MSTIALNQTAGGRTPISAWMTPWQAWGLILVVPYLLVFIFFVLYPIGYGFWVARRPETYAHLFEDPIFARSVVNTLVFLIVAGSAWEWWKLLRGTKRIVLHESEFIPLSRAESTGV